MTTSLAPPLSARLALTPKTTLAGRRMREARSREDAWETDGGAALPPLRHPVVGARMIAMPGNPRR
ncbi:hypothetical protein ACFU3J_20545 [Streptomyces sp. NPDC057411]|uniref:hypothetical protein n=1 Tax=unclassified Streptomyces TaxID=2593676 RepID=UPI0036257EDF